MSRKWLRLAPVGTPGIWSFVVNMLPTRCGSYFPPNQFVSITAPALSSPGTTNRAWCALLNSDAVVGYVGTSTKLYQYDGATTFTDRSKVGNYGPTSRAWNFCQFGDVTIASNRTDAVQFRNSTGSSAFADLTGAPKATILVTQAQQVLAFDINDGAEKRNAFATCAPGDYTDWTSAGATTATPITHRSGRITTAVAFRDYVLAFKQNSVYKLTYTGNITYKWRVECIATGKGAWNTFDAVNCGEFVIFSGPGGVWKFDGSTFTELTQEFGEIPFATASWYAPRSGNVYFNAYVYNVVSDSWGVWDRYTTATNGTGVSVLLSGDAAAMNTFAPTSTALPDYTLGFGSNLATGSVYGSSTVFSLVGGIAGFYCGLITGVEGAGGRAETRFGGADLDTTISIARTSDIGPSNTAMTLYGFRADNKDAYSLSDAPLISAVSGGTADITVNSSTAQKRFDFNMTAPYGRFALSMGAGYIEILDINLAGLSKPSGRL